MSSIEPQKIILKPIVTEKSVVKQTNGVYSFWVSLKATKNQIDQAFNLIFNLKPLKINTLQVKGKNKTDWKKRRPFKKSDRKKAIIYIGKGKTIDLLSLKNDKK